MSSGNKNGSANGTVKYEARLCHVVKRPDFDGYGFNLHAEKGRPGQYIGKVDDGSPAESAGLRQGDRIIEVNGTNITTETHKKVVELIKSVPNETKLLVIDPRADGNDLKMASSKAKNGGVDVNDNSKQIIESSEKSTNQNKHDVNGDEDANNKKNNNVDTSANKMTNGDAKKQPPHAVDQIIEDTKALSVVATSPKTAESNGKSAVASANGSSTKEGLKLNLNMTAAELRAQLAARKKYDPKNDVCDLRKKYEIIQKM
ncbi:Na(+)/H(+) exchange regulatory cofactor NHE-RF1 [Toxorhynchites rutilus septentrionalis]|uniref:Na(+)/H(+) exchange regulatory cofactor NHE-RF1 n=1 Tax=Toxorhynchites rutilus septentrionalis TaxID=329112 RepID=UPI00247AF198|nr:Na(+)/H(+) exchange regulatory cofactor NHE-RF1 [Toxorhynchites rutilus septentrionalis]